MNIKFYAVGGTIDKVYFDRISDYQVGESMLVDILREAKVTFDYECDSLIHKDSLDMTDADRQMLFEKIKSDENQHIVVTHGTDTMIETAKKLQGIENKTVVLTGAMQPAKFKSSDAEFNVGFAVAAVQTLPAGVYIAMNGRIFDPDKVRKYRELNRFEDA
ncbi:MAG: asparaginase [Deltaproteobacteria bacterium]|nr:MAG: asparaginase [Deltaproteobacteria bacterium]